MVGLAVYNMYMISLLRDIMCWANDDGVDKSCKGAPGFEIIINKQLFPALNR